MLPIQIIIDDQHTGRSYTIADARGKEWFAHYTLDGSGFGYLSFSVHRTPGTYQDIGYGYRLRAFKGPFKVLFDGQIVRITEARGEDGPRLDVWALGWVHVAGNTRFNRVYCDTRLRQWYTVEDPSGSLRPDKFNVSAADDALTLEPRRGIELAVDDYTAVYYDFQFDETAARFTADYELSIPAAWVTAGGGLTAKVLDGDGTELWSEDTDGSGSLDLGGAGTGYEIRLYFTGPAAGTSTRDDVYVQFSNVKVFSTAETVNLALIAEDLVDVLSDAGYGLSPRIDALEDVGYTLEPAVFENDQTPKEILAWGAQFGDQGGPVVWGVTFDDTRRLFLEAADYETVRYVIPVENMRMLEQSGDWAKRAQVVYGIYQDMYGVTQRTDDLSNTDVIASLGGYYRREAVQLGGPMTEAQALYALAVWLVENEKEAVTGTFEVQGYVLTPEGRRVAVEEITPGGAVEVRGWRAFGVQGEQRDYRRNVITFPLKGVIVREDEHAAELVPKEELDAFERNMAIIRELRS